MRSWTGTFLFWSSWSEIATMILIIKTFASHDRNHHKIHEISSTIRKLRESEAQGLAKEKMINDLRWWLSLFYGDYHCFRVMTIMVMIVINFKVFFLLQNCKWLDDKLGHNDLFHQEPSSRLRWPGDCHHICYWAACCVARWCSWSLS